jgi:molybdenum cofactor synthesis domain-containing protein
MEEFELLEKTELRIENLGLRNVNLTEVANAVADTLEIDRNEVLVIDARGNLLTLDIMRDQMRPSTLVGKQHELFLALDKVVGVSISDETTLCSEGILGWILVDQEQGRQSITQGQEIAANLRSAIARRVIVFATGPEVIGGEIEDTNTPTIAAALTSEGYRVTAGGPLDDDIDTIAGTLGSAIRDRGFGVVITTGGVGAETKDKTVEALEMLDKDASTPYLAKFEKGQGRHAKDGIRIGVAELGEALLVALPGPNDEVVVGIQALIAGLIAGEGKQLLAERIAGVLRKRMSGVHHKQEHHSSHSLSQAIFGSTPGLKECFLEATESGLIAGLELLGQDSNLKSLQWQILVEDGMEVSEGTRIVRVEGTASELDRAEDYLLGPLGFASGIATQAAIFKAACPLGLSLACGGWKKLPAAMKPLLREGLKVAGIFPRLVAGDFVYIGKNGVKLLGGVVAAIEKGRSIDHGPVSIQVSSAEESLFAAEAGAGIIMVDTGKVDDLQEVNRALAANNFRHSIVLAFGGGVQLDQLDDVRSAGADAVDIGRAILDAPLLDLRIRVV